MTIAESLRALENIKKIVQRLTNIQILEVTFSLTDSDGKPIEGTQHDNVIIYNLETISEDEAEELIHTGAYKHDSRILVTTLDIVANVFPHLMNARAQAHNEKEIANGH